ncbi:hypothetical protein R1sor_003439 [Riccia sorocarpa]|uniref:non-specific serine/threonine protein kinase n=1 Tax=Riccia sorocarpa TaxID=122646 RepID=A0ABD3H4K5_9MARC
MSGSQKHRILQCRFFPWLVIYFFCSFLRTPLATSLSADATALLEFKRAVRHDPERVLRSWKEMDPVPCNWMGITCGSMDEVLGIELESWNLTGSVPESLGQIKSLVNISLANNFLFGPIPSTIFNLTSLRFLDLHNNNFSSHIPTGFSRMSSLEYLDLNDNWLSGTIPDDFATDSPLWFISFSGNNFSTQPFPFSVTTLRGLQYLDLSYCSLVGKIPSSLGDLKELQQLYLQGNNLTKLPGSLGGLDSAWIIDVSANQLTGSIPPEFGNMKSIEVIRLYENNLTGGIPKELAAAASTLVNLDLGVNNLTGPIPSELANLTGLLLLHLQDNSLSGTLPDRLFANMTVLEDVFLYGNSFTGPLPEDLGVAQPLKVFDVAFNFFSGLIPPNFCGKRQLQRLVLMDNNFSGPIPEALGECPTLFRVRLSNNQLMGPIPRSFGLSATLEFLDLVNNNLTGHIPEEIGRGTKLGSLQISGNQLSGGIPVALANLMTLEAANNQLTGSFESDLCSNTMDRLDLSYNSLSGHLPLNLDICKNLSFLYLQGNQISGVIPPAIAFMEELQEINISHNQLSGSVPVELSGSKTLQSLDVSYNFLGGPVSVTGFVSTLSPIDFEGNKDLCGIGDVATVKRVLPPCPSPPETKPKHHGKLITGTPLILLIVAGILTPLLCWFAICICLRSKFYREYCSRKEVDNWTMIMFQNVPDLCVEDVLNALDEDNLVGCGGSGKVYKGELRAGKSLRGKPRPIKQPFVVKKLKTPVERGSGCFDHGFRSEVETLGNIRHFNVVKLLASCSNKKTKLLIFEYMPNGSLADQLHGSKGGMLSWETRYKIALGAAQGLMYLHYDCVPPILHRDVSSGNILLDTDYSARLADFGLAKLVEDTKTLNTVSILMGSHGYIAPECAFAAKANEKTDVYSFGVVLLELLTGRRAVEGNTADGEHITMWVQWKTREKDGIIGALDPRLGEISVSAQEEMIMVLRIGLFCTAISPEKRPGMREVVRMLIDVRNSSQIPLHALDCKNKKNFKSAAADELLHPINIPKSQLPDSPKSPPPLITL